MIKDLKDLNNLDKILNEYKDLVIQVFQVDLIRKIIKEYRFKREEGYKSNSICFIYSVFIVCIF